MMLFPSPSPSLLQFSSLHCSYLWRSNWQTKINWKNTMWGGEWDFWWPISFSLHLCLQFSHNQQIYDLHFLFKSKLMVLKLMPMFQLKLDASEFCNCNCFMLYFPNETNILLSFLPTSSLAFTVMRSLEPISCLCYGNPKTVSYKLNKLSLREGQNQDPFQPVS